MVCIGTSCCPPRVAAGPRGSMKHASGIDYHANCLRRSNLARSADARGFTMVCRQARDRGRRPETGPARHRLRVPGLDRTPLRPSSDEPAQCAASFTHSRHGSGKTCRRKAGSLARPSSRRPGSIALPLPPQIGQSRQQHQDGVRFIWLPQLRRFYGQTI
jgi:hypothetical protein